MDLKKALNLNTYEWWRNHRRFVTLGIFLALFAGYVRGPSAKDFNIKDTCSKYFASIINQEEAARRLGLKEKDDEIRYCSEYMR